MARSLRATFAALLLALCASAVAQPLPRQSSFVLVAKRSLSDPFFGESVVLVARQPGGGFAGVVLNKPLDVRLSKIFSEPGELRAPDANVHYGGPVMRERLAIVFRSDSPPVNAMEMMSGLYLSLNHDLLKKLLADDKSPELRVYAGHSGWAPGQLENEVQRGSWHLLPAEARYVFSANPKALWRQLEARASATTVHAPGGSMMQLDDVAIGEGVLGADVLAVVP